MLNHKISQFFNLSFLSKGSKPLKMTKTNMARCGARYTATSFHSKGQEKHLIQEGQMDEQCCAPHAQIDALHRHWQLATLLEKIAHLRQF
jgi:hypothetical protein